MGEICINVMETSNEPVLLDGCNLLNPEGTDLTSLITLKKAFRYISGGLSVPCPSSHEDLEVVAVDLASEIKSITSSSNVFEDNAKVDGCEQFREEGTAMKSDSTGITVSTLCLF